MTLPVSIRVNVRAPFPTRVQGASFITVGKANGVWTIAPNYQILAPNVALTQTQIIALQDTVTGAWSQTSAAALVSGALSQYRIITDPGAVTVLPTDVVLLFEKTSSGASTISLPASGARGGLLIKAKDLTGDANANPITFVPFGSETIDGFDAADAATNGTAVIDVNYGVKTLYPLLSGGWYAGN